MSIIRILVPQINLSARVKGLSLHHNKYPDMGDIMSTQQIKSRNTYKENDWLVKINPVRAENQ
jgi:hypothetical protein